MLFRARSPKEPGSPALRDGEGPFFSIQKELLEPQSLCDCGVQDSNLPDGLVPPEARPQGCLLVVPRPCFLGAAGKAVAECLKDLCVTGGTHCFPKTAPLPGVGARAPSMASAKAPCSYKEVPGSRAGRPAEGPAALAPPHLGGAQSATRFGTCSAGRVREGSAGQGRPLVPCATAMSCSLRGLSKT